MEQNHLGERRWWHLLLSVVALTQTLTCTSAFIKPESFSGPYLTSTAKIYRNSKNFIFSKERERENPACWPWKASTQARRGLFMLDPRSRCPRTREEANLWANSVHGAAVPSVLYQGKELLREKKKTQNPERVCLLRGWGNLQEGCWKKHATSFERQERVQMSWYFAQMSVLFFFFFLTSWVEHPRGKFPTFVVA